MTQTVSPKSLDSKTVPLGNVYDHHSFSCFKMTMHISDYSVKIHLWLNHATRYFWSEKLPLVIVKLFSTPFSNGIIECELFIIERAPFMQIYL